jgi:hypothetical protein
MSAVPSVLSGHVHVRIPTSNEFVIQWHNWTHATVARAFRRNKDRIPDAAQNARLRLLSKDFIARWFYKHLTHEMVDRREASRILGGKPVEFIGSLSPVAGRRGDPCSLWRVSDVLGFAKFDLERYFYSVQRHTIDSAACLRLLGYGPTDYGVLKSLYFQGKLLPSEFTEHPCPGRDVCPQCARGRDSLRAKGISLASQHDWTRPEASQAVAHLRWNDSQLTPFLRNWRNTNRVFAVPRYVVRIPNNPGIEAGLLAYAARMIHNEVINEFKRVGRGDDLSISTLNKGRCPELSDSDVCAWESPEDGGDQPVRVLRDPSSLSSFRDAEHRLDLRRMLESTSLTEEELAALGDETLGARGIQPQKAHRTRTAAISRLRSTSVYDDDFVQSALDRACRTHGVTEDDVFGTAVAGRPVLARTDLFGGLVRAGMSQDDVALRLGVDRERVRAAVERFQRTNPPGARPAPEADPVAT